MERLERKKINGRIYYYYSKWERVDGRCRRIWQKYLGKLEDIAKAVEGGGPAPLFAEVFQWGLPSALWKECQRAEIGAQIDKLCPKRAQGLTIGQYVEIASLNRAIGPNSKRSMWEWFSQTTLMKIFPQASKAALSSQRFWDHMNKIDAEKAHAIWKNILSGVIKREEIDLASVSYDGTNFYTFIDTFNTKCQMAKRGKNKQGRNNLRQINYALFCSADGHIPLFYDSYEGNRNDAKQFPLMLEKFYAFVNKIGDQNWSGSTSKITLVFDKGNNSEKNFSLIDTMGLNYVGSVKLDEKKELARVSNKSTLFKPCDGDGLQGTKSFRAKKNIYGKKRCLVVTYNENLFNAQFATVQEDIKKANERLSQLRQKLEDRINGLTKRGKKPTVESIERQCRKILSRQHLKDVIKISVGVKEGVNGIQGPGLEYTVDVDAFHTLSETYLGKNLIVTNREDWSDAQIIKAYRSQYIIEDVFKEMKDRNTGSWWPLHHWTDSKIKVHALYCTIALLIRALMYRRIRENSVNLSMKRALKELDNIREVVNFYPKKRNKKNNTTHSVLTKTSEIQKKLIQILRLKDEKNSFLG